ncbi:MAG: twin transrane helix small protein [Nevskia sp.]|nr:twin transrane helix small protein [Nevskia sp.]
MIPKLIIVVLLLAIVVSLFSGLTFLLRDSSQSRRTVWALTIRVGLSVTLVLFLLLSLYMGWIKPHGIGH